MSLYPWKQTFKDGSEPLKNAAVTIYLAKSPTVARVFDEAGQLHDEAPQLHTDINGQLYMQIDSADYPVTTMFDITVVPDELFNPTSETQYQYGILIQSTGVLMSPDWPTSGLCIDFNQHFIKLGNPASGSTPGGKLDDTGLWLYGAAGAELFGFSTIASGTVAWNSTTLSAGEFVLGDYNGESGVRLRSGNFRIKVGTSGTVTIAGGSMSVTSGSIDISSTGQLNVSAGTHTWSGGTFNITGASISISSTGSFACAGASFSITAGTAEISTTSGLTIASGSKLSISSTNGIYLGTASRIYYSSTTTYFDPQTDDGGSISMGGPSIQYYDFSIYASHQIVIDAATTGLTISGTTIGPKNTNTDLGSSGVHFDDVYGDTFFQKTPGSADDSVTSFDHLDDLEVVSRYGGPESPTLFNCLPLECTNIRKLAKEEGIEPDDVFGRKDLEGRIFYNPLMVGIFSLGAIKQLYSRVLKLEMGMS